jgi:hypothetical protein
MRVNSPVLQTVTRYGDEAAFNEWLRFYEVNNIFPNLAKAARLGNVSIVATFGDWPPTHPGEWQTFERNWFTYHMNGSGATTMEAEAAVRKRHALPDRPTYADSRAFVQNGLDRKAERRAAA